MDRYIVRDRGVVYRIAKTPFEENDLAAERAWFIAKLHPTAKEMPKVWSRSCRYVNEKYLGMKYDEK